MSLHIAPLSKLGLPPERASTFFETHWKRHIALCDPAFYRWQFLEGPENGGRDSCWGVYDNKNDELLGLMGLNPREYFCGTSRMPGAEMTTFISSPRGTRLGAGARLIQALQDTYPLLMGMSVSQQGVTAFSRAGFRILRTVPRFLRIYNLSPLQPHARIDPLVKKLFRDRPPHPFPHDLRLGQPTPAGVESCMDWLCDHAHGFVRHEQHLAWRFDRHPVYHYSRVELQGEQGPAQLHYRVHALKDFTILHILDAYGPGVEDCLPAIDHLAATHNADIADFFCTHSGINRHFYARGWFSNADDDCFRFPHLFNPVEMREPLTNSLTVWSRDHMDTVCDFGRLYLTKQDMDFDRPAGDMLDNLTEVRI
jgi:hypothetical protein